MKKLSAALIALGAALLAPAAQAAPEKAAVASVINNYLPGTSGFVVKVDSIALDARARKATVFCNEAASYLSLDPLRTAALTADVAKALGPDAAGYKVEVRTAGHSLSELARFATKPSGAPREKLPFVVDKSAQPAPKGLDGANIALWQSHGWYFEPKLNRWEWQRARIFQTVEDLYTQGYVMPFLMPMLRNAGAYVMSPRERDTNLTEIIVDNDGSFAHPGYSDDAAVWTDAGVPAFAYRRAKLRNDENPFREGTARKATTVKRADKATTATWKADIPE
ncbi:MAG: xanthan lyase, partial [Muribaculaceae bacterium]|nr:xanthan lyase [Muribaculaceae bacterium]